MVYLCIDIVVILYPPIASRRVQMLVSGSFHIFAYTEIIKSGQIKKEIPNFTKFKSQFLLLIKPISLS